MKLRQRIRLALGRVASTHSTPFGEKPMTFATSGSAAGKGEHTQPYMPSLPALLSLPALTFQLSSCIAHSFKS